MDLQSRLLMAAIRKYFHFSMELEPGSFNYPKVIPSQPIPLYIHIPFCESLCPFCSFHRIKIDRQLATAYFDALSVEVDRLHQLGFAFNEVYVGGGTPTTMPAELVALLCKLQRFWSLNDITVETNPNHLTTEILAPLKQAGVTRLSVGVQSLQDKTLQHIGRYDAYGSGDSIIARLSEVRGQFKTFNVDMIFNLPGQTESDMTSDVALLKKLAVDQISYYPLMPALPNKRKPDPDFTDVSFGKEKYLYQLITAQLSPDYKKSSVWCFNKKPQLSDEYLISSKQYLGIGSGSISLIGNRFLATTFDIQQYIRQTNAGAFPWQAVQNLSAWQLRHYTLMTRLFGLNIPADTDNLPGLSLRLMRGLGAVHRRGDAYHLTQKGQYWWLILMREFFMGVNGYRRQLRYLNAEPELEID